MRRIGARVPDVCYGHRKLVGGEEGRRRRIEGLHEDDRGCRTAIERDLVHSKLPVRLKEGSGGACFGVEGTVREFVIVRPWLEGAAVVAFEVSTDLADPAKKLGDDRGVDVLEEGVELLMEVLGDSGTSVAARGGESAAVSRAGHVTHPS